MSSSEIMRDDRAPSFFRFGQVVCLIAEKHFRIPLDETTAQRWRELMGLLREFDTLADDGSISRARALRLLENFESFASSYPHLAPDSLPAETFERLLQQTGEILDIGDQVAQEQDIDEYIRLRKVEAISTTDLLALTATSEMRDDIRFDFRFMPAMRKLGETACLLDSIVDAQHDFVVDKLAIEPNRAFYIATSRALYHSARESIPVLEHSAILKELGAIAIVRARNRIQNGLQPYSTLNRLPL